MIPFGSPRFSEILHLRDVVLRQPLNMEFKIEDIQVEYDSLHLGCYSNQDRLLGCLILKRISNDIVKMRQVAVNPHIQGSGVGTFMVRDSEEVSRAHQYKRIELSARITAVPFYEKLGYNSMGDIYKEVGIEHLKMYKDL